MECVCCGNNVSSFARLYDLKYQEMISEYAWDQYNLALETLGHWDPDSYNFTVCENCYKESGIDRIHSWELERTS